MDDESDDGGLEYWQTTGQWQQLLSDDPDYLKWLETLNSQRKEIEHGNYSI